MPTDTNVMVVEDEKGVRVTMVGILEDAGYRTFGLERGINALEVIKTSAIDVIITDIRLPDINGLEILEAAKEINPEVVVIMITGYASVETAIDAVNQGAYAYFVKPLNPDEMKTSIANALKQQRLSLENQKLVESLQCSNNLLSEANRDLWREIAERKRVELELQDTNGQLDEQNEELQAQSEELLAQQQELMEKTAALEKASRHKSEFLSRMSHELRTPLNVIIGFTELMLDGVIGVVGEEQRQCLHDILDSSKHLLNLINDILDLSKIEAGKTELKIAEVDLVRVIEITRNIIMPVLASGNHTIEIDVPDTLPAVRADKSKIRQVLLNLLGNAAKFTPPGGRLKVTALREGNFCRVSVADTGIGIARKDHEKIFEPFSQLDNYLVKETRGTGLGLAIARQIIDGHGGRIWVESENGRGSCFNFTLPVAKNITVNAH